MADWQTWEVEAALLLFTQLLSNDIQQYIREKYATSVTVIFLYGVK
jgi:hypothetical protein